MASLGEHNPAGGGGKRRPGARLARVLGAAAGVDPRFLEGDNHSDLLGGPDVVREVLTFLEECSTAPPGFR